MAVRCSFENLKSNTYFSHQGIWYMKYSNTMVGRVRRSGNSFEHVTLVDRKIFEGALLESCTKEEALGNIPGTAQGRVKKLKIVGFAAVALLAITVIALMLMR